MHVGTIEFAEGCRASGGRFCIIVGAWTEDDLAGMFRGGIAGGGPLAVILVVEDWDCTRGGSCGSLSFCSVDDTVLDLILEVLCRIADLAFDIDCAMEFWAAFDASWVLDTSFGDSSDVGMAVAGIWGTGILLVVWATFWGAICLKNEWWKFVKILC